MTPGTVSVMILDLDGVVTDTASVHARAWKRAFDEFLRTRARRSGEEYRPFDADAEYARYVDGKPRYDGARSFFESRGIALPFGDPGDPPSAETVCGIGNRKNAYFHEELREHGPRVYGSSIRFLERARENGIGTAVVTSSRNGREIIAAAGVGGLFDVVLDGTDSARLGLPGKPDPAIFVEAARRLDVPPTEAGVVEDAIAGVEAGSRGGFGLVVGIDRGGNGDALRHAGADIVVDDLASLVDVSPGCPRPRRGAGRVLELPSALESWGEIERELREAPPALFLDYDGTLTPIVQRPGLAALDRGMRQVIERLAARMKVAILSGRDVADVRERVGVGGVYYAGSHGFEIAAPGGERLRTERDTELEGFLGDLDAAEAELRQSTARIDGTLVERKKFSVATHYRLVAAADAREVERIVRRVAERHPRLQVTLGKKVFELRPDIDWDKGKALLRLLDVTLQSAGATPVFLGDDVTDEDALRVVSAKGIGIVVGTEDRETLARYRLDDVEHVRAFLERIAAMGDAT